MKHSTCVRLVALVCVGIVLSALAACAGGQGASTSDDKTIKLMTWASNKDLKLYQASLEKLTDTTGIRVELVQVPSANYFQKINSQILSHTLPDIFWCTNINGTQQNLARQGVLYDWSAFANGTAKGAKGTGLDMTKFAPGMLDLFKTPDGKLYGIPNEVNTYGVYYNADLFRKAGLPVPNADWTWDDMFTAAERLTRKSNGKTTRYGMHTAWSLLTSPIGVSMYSVSNGGASLAPQKLWVGVEKVSADPTFMAGARRFADAIKAGYITGPTFNSANTEGAFINGNVPMIFAGQWISSGFFAAKPKIDWGYAPLPRGSAGQVAPAESNAFCSPKQIKDPESTWKVISWMETHVFNEAYKEDPIAPIAYVPGSQGYLENLEGQGPAGRTVRATVEQELANPNKLGTAFLDPWSGKVNNLTTTLWNPAISGKKPAEATVTRWVAEVNALIGAG
jgi:multiple sugar transport system substrate-binding protein